MRLDEVFGNAATRWIMIISQYQRMATFMPLRAMLRASYAGAFDNGERMPPPARVRNAAYFGDRTIPRFRRREVNVIAA